MERLWPGPVSALETTPRPTSEEFALPSRFAALRALREALRVQKGPSLVTGEPGAGKTWLWRRLVAELPVSWRWSAIDLTPATDPAEFLRQVGHGLGLFSSDGAVASRLLLADFLRDCAADGRRWVLVVDEAQNASDAVWEEVRVLANRLGRPEGFSGLLLVGQTALARRLATHPLAALEARLSARVHLRPLDLEEARQFVFRQTVGGGDDPEALERAHRDVLGNPRRLLQWVDRVHQPGSERPSAAPAPSLDSPPTTAPPVRERAPAWEIPVLGASKPPDEVEDGVVEVGWEPTAAADAEQFGEPLTVAQAERFDARGESAAAEETIADHYAALQAWAEWSKNQGRSPAAEATAIASDEEDDPPAEAPETPGHPSVWAEGQQGFAPYSQLFTRLKQSRDSR